MRNSYARVKSLKRLSWPFVFEVRAKTKRRDTESDSRERKNECISRLACSKLACAVKREKLLFSRDTRIILYYFRPRPRFTHEADQRQP